MDENNSLSVPTQTGRRVPWLKFLVGFVGWFLVTPAFWLPDSPSKVYVPLNLSAAAALLFFRRTRIVGAGMAAAIAVNFLATSILNPMDASPRDLAPILFTSVYHYRWNLIHHYVSKDFAPGAFSECASSDLATSDRIAFVSGHPGPGAIHLIHADGSEEVNLSSGTDILTQPAWSPDGRQIAFASFGEGKEGIYIMNSDGSGRVRLTEDPGLSLGVAWSPDGRHIAFTSYEGDRRSNIYVMNADGSERVRPSKVPGTDRSPAWAPDGKQIAFTSEGEGNVDIYVMNADGSGRTNLTHHPAADFDPAWSPDGKLIAFNSDRDKPDAQDIMQVGLYVMNPDGTGVKRLTALSMMGLSQAWSPNGKCIVYQSGLSFQDWIMLVKMDGSEPVKLVHAGYLPQWSPDGRRLVYTVLRGEWNQDLYTLDLDTLKTTRLTNNRNNDTSPTWKP